MTKYILAGGYIHKAPDGGRAFVEELVKDFKLERPVKILDCIFAQEKEFWEPKLQADKEFFSQYINNFELELALPEKFVEQVKNSDVIFLRGGLTYVLMDMLNKTPNWVKYLDGKTVAGTSAGGDVLSKYSYNADTLELSECLGLLPIKFIPHFHSDYNAPNVDWDKAFHDLKNYKEELPLYALKEGEFVVITA